MSIHVIRTPVPTPEQMGKLLGVSPERVAAVRRIMNDEITSQESGRGIGKRNRNAPTKRRARKTAKSR